MGCTPGWNQHHISAIQELLDNLTAEDAIERDHKAGADIQQMENAVYHLQKASACRYKAQSNYREEYDEPSKHD